jgi:predicted MFS family arabinose efflux permease
MIGTAQAAAGMGIVLGAIGRLVDESKRTIAFGLITSASSAGMIILTPIGRTLLETQGWSAAFLAVAVLTLPMLLLAPFIGRKRNDGEPTTAAVAHQTVGSALTEALRHKGYLLLTIGFFVCGFHVTFVGAHFSNYLESEGLGWQLGATALMIIGVFNVVSCLGVGVIVSFLSKKGVLSVIYFGRAALVGAFLLFPVTEWSVYIFSAVLGILWLSTVPPTQGLVAQLFGTQYMTMLFGVVFFSHQIGSFLGAWLGALAFDHLGSYDVIWFASIGLGILSGVCHLFIDERPVGRLRTNTPATTPAE